MRNLEILISITCLLVSSYTDIRRRVIPNWLTLPVLMVMPGYMLLFHRARLLSYMIFVLSMITAGCVGVSGWGDIKLIMVIGGLNGWLVGCMTYVLAQPLLLIYIVAHYTLTNRTKAPTASTYSNIVKNKYPLAPCLAIAYVASIGLLFFFRR